ncbi:MAG: rhamnogalacturonan lyase, partial [Fibrobacter sp.]|nr:rhamnogalacturonan lyase [Fibrobacter sp.]
MGTKIKNRTTICKLTMAFIVSFIFQSFSQVGTPMFVEKLDRGLVAVRTGQDYYLSWRLLANEPFNTGFNVYRDTDKLNESPIVTNTIFTDKNAPLNSVYTVKAVVDGVEQSVSKQALILNNTEGANAGYFDIPVDRPANGSHGGSYSPGDGSAGDLDGDGQYEIVLKWDPSNQQDVSRSGQTDKVYLDAYTFSGKKLWRIDLGVNIRAGAHYTQFLVFDFDGDGKAEVMVKTAPGTKDGTGEFIKMGPASSADHSKNYRNGSGYVLSGPEYLTVFEGATGKELATEEYWPLRGNVGSWGDNYGNRVDRFNAGVAYVDGERPSALFGRGYYTRLTWAAWDWRDGKLTRRWTFDSDAGNNKFRGQGNHQVSIADVNNDGKHDIITGSAVIGSDGKGMHTTGFGHGDALHVAHMLKDVPTPQIFMPHESGGHGCSFRQAIDGKMIFNNKASGDIGRGCAAELDPAVPGFKLWASGLGLFNTSGQKVGNIPNAVNHIIWWDGQLSRELLNGNQINKWSVKNNSATRLLTATNCSNINGTKSNPILQADLFGDWREEVIFNRGNTAIRVFTTTMSTEYRLYTMMHDPVYRVATAWQNSSYNQPPHPGYYIASDMNYPPKPLNVKINGDVVVNRGVKKVSKAKAMFNPVKFSVNVSALKSPANIELF